MQKLFSTAAVWVQVAGALAAPASFQNFITVRHGQLLDGSQEFRFISWNIPNLLIIEDNLPWDAANDWRLPDEFELNDALASVRQLGGTVVRTYSIPVQRADEGGDVPKYVKGIGKFAEENFRTMDLALKLANEHQIRLIIPLVNHWPWQGGREAYAAWRGKPADAFWTDPQLISDFEQTVRHVLTRTNTLTGVPYMADKSILCWETGNEVRGPASWTATIAAFIKSIDTNHLVMDGYDLGIRPEVLTFSNIDIVTTHQYPSGDHRTFGDQIRDDARLVDGKKAYIVGEFGFAKTAEMGEALSAIAGSRAAGGLLWSLRFRDRDGGFYWHSEPDGGNVYKAFHWPGSSIGDHYDEIGLLTKVRTAAYAIRGEAVPELPVPAAPKLLPIADAAAIGWQGSVGAAGYQVERAAQSEGPWTVIATNVDEALTQYRPQFADETCPSGQWYYRVRARNAAGISAPSEVMGPVSVATATLVDELADFSKTAFHSGGWRIADDNCRAAREDVSRAAGQAGDVLIYRLPSEVRGFRAFVFFPQSEKAPKFSVSSDGLQYREIAVVADAEYHDGGDYGYWKPALYHAENVAGGRYLKLELAGPAELSRVEISHAALNHE